MLDIIQNTINIPGYQKPPDIEIIFPTKNKKNFNNTKKNNDKQEEDELEELEESEEENETIFYSSDQIKGKIFIYQNSENIFKYRNITVELIANIYTTKNKDYDFEFIHISKILDNEGEINSHKKFSFNFDCIVTDLESFNGELFSISYKIKLIITQKIFGINSTKEKNFIYKLSPFSIRIPKLFSSIKHNLFLQTKNNFFEVSFELNKNKFYIGEVIKGKITCKGVKLFIHNIEIILIRNEKLKDKNFESIISIFEICDGQPLEGDIIPINFHVDENLLTPTIKNINNGICWLKYYVKLVFHFDDIDENNNFFKTQEIIFYRNKESKQ